MDLNSRVDVNFRRKDARTHGRTDGRTDGKPDANIAPCLSRCDNYVGVETL